MQEYKYYSKLNENWNVNVRVWETDIYVVTN